MPMDRVDVLIGGRLKGEWNDYCRTELEVTERERV